MSAARNPRYWIEKRAQRKSGYPLATVAYYGPDASFASKVVVGIVTSEQEDEPAVVQKWFADTTDARHDATITQQILALLEAYHVHRVAMVDRLLGCPHEEGIDYPEREPSVLPVLDPS